MSNNDLVYLDGFSGYGGFHLGLESAGFKFSQCYFSEMDKHAIANYSYNFPNSIYAGLIQSITVGTLPKLDLFTFGWPCQDNSIAGKRKGQSGGKRSSLLNEAVRIINELRPRHFIAENVPGLLSVNEGVDYIKAVKILSEIGESCPQYDIEMQLLNTKWVLPQNRERLYFVGHLRDRCSRKLFPLGSDSKEVDGVQGQELASNTLTARYAGATSGGSYIIEDQQLQIAVNTKSGYDVARDGDSINYSFLSSATRRGRVGKGVALSVDTSCNIGVVVGRRIRRFTEIECERLQGLPDNWTRYGNYSGTIKEISDTQRYKLCGNGVSVPIVEMIAKRLFELNY